MVTDIFIYFLTFQTPLHRATNQGQRDIMEILLRNGANINEKSVRIHRRSGQGDGKTERLSEQL